MKITIEQLKSIFAAHGADMSESDFAIMLEQCNAQDGQSGRTAEEWANFFAPQIAFEAAAESAEANEFCASAYGTD